MTDMLSALIFLGILVNRARFQTRRAADTAVANTGSRGKTGKRAGEEDEKKRSFPVTLPLLVRGEWRFGPLSGLFALVK